MASLTIPLRTVSVCDDSNLPVWHHIERLFRIRREELHVVLMLVETFNGIRPALLEELPCLRKELREKHRISGVGQRVNGPASGRPEPPKVRPAGRSFRV